MVFQSIQRSLAAAGILLCITACSEQAAETPATTAERPNFLIIMADDLGFSDIGIYGSEIETPNIDQLARDGLLFSQFYAAGTCSPSRSMLLTGVDHHRAGLGNMIEHMAGNQKGMPGYEGYLNDGVVTVSERLQSAGYRTYMAGKWHLGMTEETSPAQRGFDRSFVLLNGGASHFDQRGLDGRTDPAPYAEDGEKTDLPDDFGYSTDFYTRKMMAYISGGKDSDTPFFGYLAYTAPHWPLQAPQRDIDKYAGVYDGGWLAIQTARLERLKASGIVPSSATLPAIITDMPSWDALSDKERRIEARRMEIYAAMVDHMDQQIGVLIAHLKAEGVYDNTVIVFLSDNGAEGAPLYKLPMFKTWMDSFDNRLENMGRQNSYVYYEERWAQVGMTPLRLYKGLASDGGMHVPAFVAYPGLANGGEQYDGVLSIMDIAPTLLELAGLDPSTATFEGRDYAPIQGKSMASLLAGEVEALRTAEDGLGFELFNKRGYRRGKWKAVNMHPPWGTDAWQLFDTSVDPGETVDVALRFPEVLAQLVTAWDAYAAANGVILSDTPPER